MSKRPYRSVRVNNVNIAELCESVRGQPVVVGIDVGKADFFASFMNREQRRQIATIRWQHPAQTREFGRLVASVAEAADRVEVAMEPSGVYGDALRFLLITDGFPVFRVSPKRSHDAREVYDGVPSLHDAKGASIVAKLHLDGASEPWPIKSDRERELTATLRTLEVYEQQFQKNRNRLEALTARHWPELTEFLSLGSATLLELLIEYGDPAAVANDSAEAARLMRKVGGRFLDPAKIERVIASAATTVGMPPIASEAGLIQGIAAEARRNQQAASKARRAVEALSEAEGSTKEMAAVIGKTTAAVLVAGVGDPLRYASPQALLKSIGLNLKEKSSGKKVGPLRITKRGPGIVRMFLWMAALRLIHSDPIVAAWYAKKVRRDGGRAKAKAVVAVMRKLVLALWYVARGDVFDAAKLFDRSRLDLRGVTTTTSSAPSERRRTPTAAEACRTDGVRSSADDATEAAMT